MAPVQVIKRPNAPGCLANEKAVWCKVRSCNMGKFITSCAECDEFAEVNDCKKFNNFISKIFNLVAENAIFNYTACHETFYTDSSL